MASMNSEISAESREMSVRGRAFVEDVVPLLAKPGSYDAARAARLVLQRLVARLPGERRSRLDSRA